MSENRWMAHRAGILNYWYYDEAEFRFSGGRLLLRGSNGSGKSVTMQSLVTVLLDGVKRADRLDSFGSKSRTMDDYLLGEKEISEYEERTGYLYLEYKREKSDQYITTGIGLHARRGSSKVDFWGFLLQNGRRIGQDIQLYHLSKNPENGQEQKIPLTKRELENAIGQDGRVTTEQREYMAMVNQYIFGYEDIGKYEELMKLLIQLRSPKLSRDFKPSVIYEILNASLPTLSDDDLRPLAETLENMEKTRLAIEQLQREQGAFSAICEAYTTYNEAVLAERILGESECRKFSNRLSRQLSQQQERLEEVSKLADKARARQQELTVEGAALQREQSDLQEHEAYKTAEKKKEAEVQRERAQAEKIRREDALAEKRRRELFLRGQMEKEQHLLDQLEFQAEEMLRDLSSLAEQADFAAHEALQQEFGLSGEKVQDHFNLWRSERQKHGKYLQLIHKCLLRYEQKEQKARQVDRELGEENRRLDQYSYERQRLNNRLDQERENLVKAFYEWKDQWEMVLPFDKQQEIRMSGSLRGLFQGTRWMDIQNILGAVASERQRSLDAAIGKVRLMLQELTSHLAAAEDDLRSLQETKEAEPEMGEAHRRARQALKGRNIPFLPLYEATEYRSQVTPEIRERLESALLEAGILNALLLESDDAAKSLPEDMRGAVIFSGEAVLLAESLLDYLEPVAGNGISKARITEVLSGISVTHERYSNAGGTSVNLRQGSYALGKLAGRAAEREAALFIGKQARETYRRQQIAEKEREIASLQEEITDGKAEESQLLEENKGLRIAQECFPSQENLQSIYDAVKSNEHDIERQQQRLQEKDEEKKKLALELREERTEILSRRGETSLSFASAAYEDAIGALSEYGEEWQRLTLLQVNYAHAAELLEQHSREAEYAADEVDGLKGEVLEKELVIAKLEKTIQALTQQLSQMDAAAIEERIAVVIARLAAISTELPRVSQELGQNEERKESLSAEMKRMERRKELCIQLQECWQGLVQTEQKRGFPINEKKTLKDIVQFRQKNRDTASLHSLAQKVENRYAEHRDKIAEYRFSLREVLDDIGEMPELRPEDEDWFLPLWERLRDRAVRQLAVTETGGKPLSPYEQQEQIKDHLVEQETLLSEQDKQIYQEIILNSIGRTISDKIYSAEDWIKKMNHLMARSDTSSALRFRLEWKPLIGDEDKEMGTAELVELLHSDPELMKMDDMKRLEEHFSSRIRRARDEAKAQEMDAEAFQASVREQLDYRKWFQFRLSYDKGEQIQRRELTDKAFFRFSGGEKAMAMYVPLFSAAYSRYLDAGKDAPRLITLDEAFAGVDEQNMRDMFRLVEQMGFNYIMNSQAIWGDYDVVPSLNMYELLRPLNVNYVSVIGWHWNGNSRSILTEEMDDE